MSGLRERQKADRRLRILDAARTLFAEAGYERTTIESIAAAAAVSGVTVHNYYGTKAGVLLALVADSDRQLVERLSKLQPRPKDGLRDLVLRFAAIIREHAIAHLSKALWRQVIAASIVEAGSPFGKAYHALDHQLSLALVRQIEGLQREGRISAVPSAYHLGKALFHLQNTRFTQYVSDPDARDCEVEAKLRGDLDALLALPAAMPG